MPPPGRFEIDSEAKADFASILAVDGRGARQLFSETEAIKKAVAAGEFLQLFGDRLKTTNGRSLLPVSKYFIGLVFVGRDVTILAYLKHGNLGDWASAALQ
jgi:hypothetical protein